MTTGSHSLSPPVTLPRAGGPALRWMDTSQMPGTDAYHAAAAALAHARCVRPAPAPVHGSHPRLDGCRIRPVVGMAAVAPPSTLEEHAKLAGNQECADCRGREPDWASVNQGVTICITCAGAHRSLGAHISKVKSLTLDAWKPEEVQVFLAKGGNAEVNRRLVNRDGFSEPPPPQGATRAELDAYIIAKYRVKQVPSAGQAVPPHVRSSFLPPHSSAEDGNSPLSEDDGEGEAGGELGTTCHQGLVIAEVVSVDLSSERARELRFLGPLFLSLSVSVSLGHTASERTESRRGSQVASWSPPVRRQLLWDVEDPTQRWLWCRVHDGGDLGGEPALAGEGRVDLLEVASRSSGKNGEAKVVAGAPTPLAVDIFVPPEDEDEDEEDLDEDFLDPARGTLCGEAHLRLTIIDMSGLDKKRPVR